jgi:hypothetical protein
MAVPCLLLAFLRAASASCARTGPALLTERQVAAGACHVFAHCVFAAIHSSAEGGAVFCALSADASAALAHCAFACCSSAAGGGAVAVAGCALAAADCCARSCFTWDGAPGQCLSASSPALALRFASVCECGSARAAALGSVYAAAGTPLALAHVNFTACRVRVDAQPSDGAAVYAAGGGPARAACAYATLLGNAGRTVAHADARANASYACANVVNNTCRLNLLYQSAQGSETIERCVFVANRATDGALGITRGSVRMIACVLDFEPAAPAAAGAVCNSVTATHALWNVDTELCPGFARPSSGFAASALRAGAQFRASRGRWDSSRAMRSGGFADSPVRAKTREVLSAGIAPSRSLGRSPMDKESRGLRATEPARSSECFAVSPRRPTALRLSPTEKLTATDCLLSPSATDFEGWTPSQESAAPAGQSFPLVAVLVPGGLLLIAAAVVVVLHQCGSSHLSLDKRREILLDFCSDEGTTTDGTALPAAAPSSPWLQFTLLDPQ